MMLSEEGEMKEGRGEALLRLLVPVIRSSIEQNTKDIDRDRADLALSSLDDIASMKHPRSQETGMLENTQTFYVRSSLPVIHHRADGDRLPADMRKYARYFLKNMFRLNNIHGDNEFFHPPEVIEKFWEIIAHDQGTFRVNISPIRNEMYLILYRTTKTFGLARTDNPDYLKLSELLILEGRRSSIRGCKIEIKGLSHMDDLILQEMMSIETNLFDDHADAQHQGRIVDDLTTEGTAAFQKRLRELSGITVSFHFPVADDEVAKDPEEEEGGRYNSLRFDLKVKKGRFLLNDLDIEGDDEERLSMLIGGKLMDLSQRIYHGHGNFPTPDLDELDREVHLLMDKAEKSGLSEALAREIIAKITVLDYYESLTKFSMAISKELKKYLESTVVVTFTIPQILLAFLNEELEHRTIDEIIGSILHRGSA